MSGKWGIDMRVKSVYVKLDRGGVQQFLHGKNVRSILAEIARRVQKKINAQSEEHWRIKLHERTSRDTFVVYTDSPEEKWREVYSGRIARQMRSERNKLRKNGLL